MLNSLVEKLKKKYGVWHLLCFTIIFTEILTAIMNTIMGIVWWGRFSPDLVLIGVVDAFVVASIAAPVVIFFLNSLINSEKKAKEEVRLLNEELELRVCERTAELDESERKYRLLMEQASDGIFISDTERRLIAVNLKACEMLGYGKEELLSKRVDDIIHTSEIGRLMERFQAILDGDTEIAEYTLCRKDGSMIPVEVSVKMTDSRSVQAIARDITERKTAEEERERIQARLMESQKMEAIGRLAGGIAHDFNNLLTVIKGESSAAMAEMDERHPSREPVAQIYLSAARAGELVRKLLVFSRQQPVKPVPLDLNGIVTDMMTMLGRLIGEDITVETSLSHGLWTVCADKVGIEQVLMNLAVNARDAMPSGGRLYIRTGNRRINSAESRKMSGSRPGNFVFMEVEDTGVGMDPEEAKKIFTPFYTSKEIGKGTGLGLSVVYGIVEQHNGWIGLETREGAGSKFTIFFEAAEGRPEVTAALDMSALAGNGERILLVEDEEGIVRFAGRLLEEHGYRVFPALDAREAFDLFEKEKGDFSLVLTDVILPDENGIELIDRLRKIRPDLPVLVSSGYSDHRTQWPVIQERGYKVLEKPYSADGLLGAVREAIHNTAFAD